MSLYGRRVIDNVKARLKKYLKLPCPPYGDPTYWESTYKKLDSRENVYEWSSLAVSDLLDHVYIPVYRLGGLHATVAETQTDMKKKNLTPSRTTLLELFGLEGKINEDGTGGDDVSTMILGCGNSEFGENLLMQSQIAWPGKVIQMDISSKLIHDMTIRCKPYLDNGKMELIQDDATQLTAFRNESTDAVIDKGTLDALFCADESEQILDIMSSVNRVLKPGGIFCFMSFSEPKFMLPAILPSPGTSPRKQMERRWSEIQVREVKGINLYRCQKFLQAAIKGGRRYNSKRRSGRRKRKP